MIGRRPIGKPAQIVILTICAVGIYSLFSIESAAPAVWNVDIIMFSIFAFVLIHVLGLCTAVGKNDQLLCKETMKVVQARRQTILDPVMANPHVSASQVAMILNDLSKMIERDLEWLKNKSVIVREGGRSDGIWGVGDFE